MIIDRFKGKYGFLSNFYPCEVQWGIILFNYETTKDITYRSAEHAYQAAKATNREDQKRIRLATNAAQAKILGRSILLRPDWERIKNGVMHGILLDKFTRNRDLRQKLLRTNDAELIEGNYHHDTYWGVCYCATHAESGLNTLGRLLMEIRANLEG